MNGKAGSMSAQSRIAWAAWISRRCAMFIGWTSRALELRLERCNPGQICTHVAKRLSVAGFVRAHHAFFPTMAFLLKR
jgi:hypothetical protein